MVFPLIMLSERGRVLLSRLAVSMHLIAIAVAIGLFFVSSYIKLGLQRELSILIPTYRTSSFAAFFALIAVVGAAYHICMIKVSYDMGSYLTRYRWEGLMRLFTFVMAAIVLVDVAATLATFAHERRLAKHMRRGFFESLKAYKSDKHFKSTFDTIQLEYECCGSYNFTDWFKTSWIDEQYRKASTKHVKDGEYKRNDVPYSCCNASYPMPCVYQRITESRGLSYVYPRDVTIYTRGCARILARHYGRTVLLSLRGLLIALACASFLAANLMKLQLTAHEQTWEHAFDPEGVAPTYLYADCPIRFCNQQIPDAEHYIQTTHDAYGTGEDGSADEGDEDGNEARVKKKTHRKKKSNADDSTTENESDDSDSDDGEAGDGGGGGGGAEDDDGKGKPKVQRKQPGAAGNRRAGGGKRGKKKRGKAKGRGPTSTGGNKNGQKRPGKSGAAK